MGNRHVATSDHVSTRDRTSSLRYFAFFTSDLSACFKFRISFKALRFIFFFSLRIYEENTTGKIFRIRIRDRVSLSGQNGLGSQRYSFPCNKKKMSTWKTRPVSLSRRTIEESARVTLNARLDCQGQIT